jgi:hypothetical protein
VCRSSARVRTLALLVLTLAACRARPQPSPQYDQAYALYNRLYQKSLDDAYGDPQMLAAAELLRQVDPASSSAVEAGELLGKVEKGMKDYNDRQLRLRVEEQALEKPSRWEGSAPDLPTRQAGLPAAGPTLEMTRDDFLAHFGDCFEFKGAYQQREKQGEAYAVRVGPCLGRYPAFAQSLVVLMDNKVTAVVAMVDVKTVVVDAGSPPASTIALRPPVAPPPAAETPTSPRGPLPPGEERQIHVPGAPVPSNAAGPPSVLPW